MSDLDRRAPYGTWPSTITADLVAEDAINLAEPRLDGGDLYWLEGRPSEGGRQVIVRQTSRGGEIDVLPEGFDARTRVHEYGGGSYLVHDGVVWFTNLEDQRLYRIDGGDPAAITPEPDERAAVRYADGVVTPDGTTIVCIRESHAGDDVTNELVAVAADGSEDIVVLASGRDFYAHPRLDEAGERLVWLEWDHPNMPWDGTELYEARVEDGPQLADVRLVAGGEQESIFQPSYSPTGQLHFISDRTGWWNLYREIEDGEVEALYPSSSEFGLPMWQLGMSTYAFLHDGRIAASRFEDGADRMFVLDTEGRRAEPVDLSHTSLRYVVAGDDHVVFVGASPWEPKALLEFEVSTETVTPIRYSTDEFIEPSLISTPESIEFPTTGGATAHAVYYPPVNPDVEEPTEAQPPLIVEIHGGPTSHRASGFDLSDQFWTSRGFAYVDVNYRGSTGYGREYREALKGEWGVHDVQDAIAAARFLAERGDVDPERLIIRGGSAGGFTALLALTTDDTFAAGASYFGVGDVRTLVEHTHKFESRYIDGLMDPSVMEERSPLTHVDGLSSPVIVFQGAEDEVVPPEQAETIVAALREKGLAHTYLLFEGEQHGFRRSDTIRRCLESELSFYAQVFGFQPADDIDPVKVENL